MVQHRNRHVEQWAITKVSNMGKCNFSHLTFNKGAKSYIGKKEIASSTNDAGKTR